MDDFVEQDPSTVKEESPKIENGALKETPPQTAAQPPKPNKKQTRAVKKKAKKTRASRPYPACPFTETLPLAEAIHQYAAGQKVRRLTLLQHMQRSPTSSTTMMLITNSGKYGVTTGSYRAEYLELTPEGSIATSPGVLTAKKLRAQFNLAIEGVAPFSILYKEYTGKKLPSRDVMKDVLTDKKLPAETIPECVDTFVVNAKVLGLIQTIAGSETLFPIDARIESLGKGKEGSEDTIRLNAADFVNERVIDTDKTDWSKICFIITPIGEDGSEQRQHADLFLNSLIEPALKEFGLKIIRADKIGSPGMITSQVLEHVMRAGLAIVDLSFHNPNAFYEMALRHACALPVVQITRKSDKAPFDVNQARTIVIDTSDIYTLVPKLETYRSEIASQVRAALTDQTAGNPITVFFPGCKVTLPSER